jgi:4-amino-4-deoxy-L-arabinose transferase-like glycosyltransferase
MRSNAKILLLCLGVFALAGAVAWGVFEAMPHIEDEHANLFQAEIFAAGRATVGVPREPDSFFIPFVINTGEGKRFGKYPPGYPLLLALGAAIGQPWLVNALAAALGTLGVYLLGRDLFDRDTGLLAAALGAVSPMFVLLSGTLLAHTTSIAALVLFAWAFVRARQPGEASPVLFALGGGVLLGWAAIIRPWTALAVALPFALLGMWDVARSRGRVLRIYLVLALGAALVCSLQLVFNLATTGSPLTNTYRMWWSYDTIGFGPGHGRDAAGHTLAKGWSNLKLDLAELSGGLFGWPEPFHVPLTFLPVALGLLWPACQRFGPHLPTPSPRGHSTPGSAGAIGDHTPLTPGRGGAPSSPSTLVGDKRSAGGGLAGGWGGRTALSRLRPIMQKIVAFVVSFVASTYKEWALLLPAVSLILAQMAYWARGSSLYGPRYYAEVLPFLWIIAARGLIKFAAGTWRRRVVNLALPIMIAWSVVFTIEPRILKGLSLFDITRRDADTIAAAGPHNALVFVHGDYWTSYAALSWLNAPTLDGDVVFAKDRGPIANELVIEDYPGREIYYYDREQSPALSSTSGGEREPHGVATPAS